MSHPVPAPRRVGAALGATALAVALAGCSGSGDTAASSSAGQSSPAAAASTAQPVAALATDASATGDPNSPASQAAAEISSARAAERADGSERPQPREAFETAGPGITSGAASSGWRAVASSLNDTVSVMDCTQDILDQTTLDAVATHIPDPSKIGIVQLFASRDATHEFLTCQYQGSSRKGEGAPLVMVHYQHNLDGTRLDWCKPEPAVMADEYSFDEKTGKGLLALLKPGMVGGADGAPLLPQRSAWACTEDGTQLVSITFGSMEGYGSQSKGLTQVTNSPIANSTTLATEARDHLADTVLKDPSALHEDITTSSPFFLDYQMNQETLDKALSIPTGVVPQDMLSNRSTIDRPEGAPEPVAPGQPPRPFVGAARAAAESAAAASAAASASASASGSPSASPSGSGSPSGSASASASPSPSGEDGNPASPGPAQSSPSPTTD